MIGGPSTEQCERMVSRNLPPNCPINNDAAEDIFGQDVGSIKGKTVRRPTPHVASKLIPIPMEMFQIYRDVTIVGNIMQINQIPFFVTV